MAVVKPFRAERYDEQSAGPLEQLVAPPYDVISPEERSELPRPQPVQRRPPDAAGRPRRRPARDSRTGAERGVLARDEEPAYWFLSQDYVGPDGVARNAVRPRRLAPSRALREPRRAAARAHAQRPEGGAAAAAPRDPDAARADLPPLRRRSRSSRRRASPTCRAAATSSGGSAMRRASSRPSC